MLQTGLFKKITCKFTGPNQSFNWSQLIFNKAGLVVVASGSALSEKEAASFMEEVLLMRGLHHKNVLGFMGLVLRDNQPYALLPYMHHGNLRDYIAHRDRVHSYIHTS